MVDQTSNFYGATVRPDLWATSSRPFTALKFCDIETYAILYYGPD